MRGQAPAISDIAPAQEQSGARNTCSRWGTSLAMAAVAVSAITPLTKESRSMKFVASRLIGASILGLASSTFAADGKAVYESTCVACHATGVANAPKFGDKTAWAPRVSIGGEALVKSVIAGKGAMPAKAGNAALAEGDIRSAVDYMLAAVN
jgi:cytochrome c5